MKLQKSIFSILEPVDYSGSKTWTEWKNNLSGKEQICYYPASGADYRDIIYTSPEMQTKFGLKSIPNLYVHSDYAYYGNIGGDIPDAGEYLYKSEPTNVKILEKHQLVPKLNSINYILDQNFLGYKNIKEPEEKIHFLILNIHSDKLQERIVPLIYFHFENFNLIEELYIKHKINIHTLFRWNEGLGFGGGCVSVCPIFQYLSDFEVEYLFTETNYRDFHYYNPKIEKMLSNCRSFKYTLNPLANNLFNGNLFLFHVLKNYEINFDLDSYTKEMEKFHKEESPIRISIFN